MAGSQAAVVGVGPMGLWMAQHLAKKGYSVKVYDINSAKTRMAAKRFTAAKSLDDAVSNASIAVVAVGSKNAGKTIRQILTRHHGKTIIDISSVKTPVIQPLRRTSPYSGLIVLTHPLFGPGAKKLEDKTVVVTPFRRPAEETVIARKIFSPCKIVSMSPDMHDRVMAYAMAVPRVLMLALLECWRRKKIDVLTTSQKALMLAASTILTEKPQVINEIVTQNPYTAEAVADIQNLIKNIRQKTSANILQTYRKLATQTTDLAKQYSRAYSIIEKVA
ncbi:MAG: prephenate dehydrogenase/arogenate dehydrogenase family protein [Candidatus Caldarchaeum sp.]|uniref:Prephenate dehydrogenase n=1 Tax=Caldiarchaeum subterraneum TaxID=311458 RepID=A0A7C5LDJ5_CALS0